MNSSCGHSRIVTAIWLTVLAGFLLEIGCAAPIVWHAELPSPNGRWVAIAQTVQGGGFGSAFIATTVSLKPTYLSNAPETVLGFSCQGPVPRPYTLDNVANAGGTINLHMEWLTPSHLEVSYSGQPDIYLQSVKLWGAEISLRNLSDESTTIPNPSVPSNPK